MLNDVVHLAFIIQHLTYTFLWWFCQGCSPLPIPNREVKPLMADGTAQQCGRVGSCHILLNPVYLFRQGFFMQVIQWSMTFIIKNCTSFPGSPMTADRIMVIWRSFVLVDPGVIRL